MIEQSQNWCCELCGSIIVGLCNNENGRVTHIDSCIPEDENKIKCSCGNTFNGEFGKEDTCPDCLRKIINPNTQQENEIEIEPSGTNTFSSVKPVENIQQLNTTANSIAVETPKIKTPFCLFCRKELLPNSHGRKRLYCNDKCGGRYWIQQNKEKFNASCRVASREYQRRKQKKLVEARHKQEDILRAEMEKDNVQNI